MSIISLEKLLKSGGRGALEDMVQTAQYMDEMTTMLQQGLEMDLAVNLLAASLRGDGELVLIASSSAWAAKIRFETEKMMQLVRQSGTEVRSCRVTVSRHVRA
jgi:hypothetical protein